MLLVNKMGFKITDDYSVSELGLCIPNIYVTLKATFQVTKSTNQIMLPVNQPICYIVSADYYLYASNGALRDLSRRSVSLRVESFPQEPISLLYAHLKSVVFAGSTCVDE